ncbi:hypothetical protein [Phytohalomonas tamaricis]|uniref:hypothetical protein n=1 Tax=Phytohalomonas tamaricis TaxID=2081032 RepID=UPI000D0BBF6A|nr:hypothetical protein [Phytohalomonas tamaricis]
MVSEPQRLQYLEAMGLSAWTSRYRLPNAAPTPQCEWPELDEPKAPPQARLHALLDSQADSGEMGHRAADRSKTVIRQESTTSPVRSARALLEEQVMPAVEAPTPVSAKNAGLAESTSDPEPPPLEQAPSRRGEALRFTLQVAALDGRWLLLLPQPAPPTQQEFTLLTRLIDTAGIRLGVTPEFSMFKWPMMENLPVGDALDDARQGFLAFIEGRRSRGWCPERVLSFGNLGDELERVLDFSGELKRQHACLLNLPCWHGPTLGELGNSAEHKRALWPELARWRVWWLGDDEN